MFVNPPPPLLAADPPQETRFLVASLFIYKSALIHNPDQASAQAVEHAVDMVLLVGAERIFR